MRGSRVVVALVVTCVVSLAVAGPALAAPASPDTPLLGPGTSPAPAQQTGAGGPPVVQTDVDPDVVVMRATLAADGTASWAVSYRTRLDDENTTAAFESVQADVAANASAFTERFATGMRRTVRSAENATGREMALENVTVEATKEEFGQEYGVITYRFTWTNFGAVEGDRVRAGDALSGLFLDSETTFVLAWPDGYGVERVTPRPSENRTNAAVWHGQFDFGPNQPRLVLAPGAGASGGSSALLVGAGLALVALAAAGWLVATRIRQGDGEASGETGGTGEPAAGSDATPQDASEAEDGPPEELLSNEEKVIRLLEDSGGRVKQQQIAGEFDWTDAKTSQVVGNLRDDDAVETFRIGRENVVALPEESDL